MNNINDDIGDNDDNNESGGGGDALGLTDFLKLCAKPGAPFTDRVYLKS